MNNSDFWVKVFARMLLHRLTSETLSAHMPSIMEKLEKRAADPIGRIRKMIQCNDDESAYLFLVGDFLTLNPTEQRAASGMMYSEWCEMEAATRL